MELDFTDILDDWSGVEDGCKEGLESSPDRTVEMVVVSSSGQLQPYGNVPDHKGL